MLNKILLIFSCLLFIITSSYLYAQNKEYPDSAIAYSNFSTFLNSKHWEYNDYLYNFDLNITHKQAKNIAKIALKNMLDWRLTIRLRTMVAYKIEEFWIIWNKNKHIGKQYGPGYTIVVNSKSGKIEYFSFGR